MTCQCITIEQYAVLLLMWMPVREQLEPPYNELPPTAGTLLDYGPVTETYTEGATMGWHQV